MPDIIDFPALRWSRFLLGTWMQIWAQGGELEATGEPFTWRANSLFIDTSLGHVLVTGVSVDLNDGSEKCALAARGNADAFARRMTKWTQPPYAKVEQPPSPLAFLFKERDQMQGEIGLSRLAEWKRTTEGETGLDWILIHNDSERLLLAADESQPLAVLITCSEARISQLRMNSANTRLRL